MMALLAAAIDMILPIRANIAEKAKPGPSVSCLTWHMLDHYARDAD
jgi:hypothetical protein